MTQGLKIFLQAAKSWNADNVFKHSAAVSFCTLFSLAPITLIAMSVAGVFLGREMADRQLGLQLTQLVGAASAEMILGAAKASQTARESWWATGLGIGLMLFGATTVFGQLQGSFNDIWGVRTRPNKSGWIVLLLHRLLSLAMVLTLGFLLLVSLVLTTLLTSALKRFDASWGLQVADVAVSLIVVSVLFALLFKIMPDVRLRWREVWLGAVVTAALFTVGRYAIALYLGHSTIASIYGTAGSLVALLIWVYYSCAILFFGVEFMRAYRALHNLPVQPKETAILINADMLEQQNRKKHEG